MSNEITKSASHELSTNVTPMQMIQLAFDAAIKQGSAMEVVNLILEQQKWMIQHSEEEAFNAALRRIQDNLKKIQKKGWNKETKSWFARSEDVDDAIEAQVSAEGMTLNFEPAESSKPDEVVIIGVLALGAFSKRYPLPMPADGKGAKGGGVMSRTHATGAAITYSKRYLKNMIFDLRFEEHDDDGNGASGVTNEQAIEWIDSIRDADSPISVMEAWKSAVDAAKRFTPIDYKAMTIFTEARDERLKELKKSK